MKLKMESKGGDCKRVEREKCGRLESRERKKGKGIVVFTLRKVFVLGLGSSALYLTFGYELKSVIIHIEI